ncbi:uncharacterized protein N7483_011518 [Penicillium malachiteum]|uniref:uncharacterized protein n=1 Tax=Penicillium malachiteum TaxID=1324776 RepID=UPI0025473495|nr:uncharacterized protein N7483_011518 [Penicillium malachiteum]KAJ5714337.1 hypothetical protein N7483_011518 [Penicillium malachiteum]
MADNSSPDYKSLYLQEKERREQAEARQKQAEARQKQAEDEAGIEKERNRSLTFMELIRHGHDLLSRPLRIRTPSRSTTGTIPPPTGKYCPVRLEPWTNCALEQQEIYDAVCKYLQPTKEAPSRLPTSLITLEADARRFCLDPMHSEQSVESYERIAVEGHVRDIVAELCKIDAARNDFSLGDGIWFDNHKNSLDHDECVEADLHQSSSIHNPKPDQFCIHRVNGNTSTLLTTVEYKPPHKLPTEALRIGLRPMDLWRELVCSKKIPQEEASKLKYNIEKLACSALVQEYHVMIQEGLQYSWLTNGIARVLLRIPYDEPGTLQYFFCDPNGELKGEIRQNFQEPKTSIARVLCLCLMAFRAPLRDHEWRNNARSKLPLWTTSFDHTRSQIPSLELQQLPLHSDSTDYASPESTVDPSPDYQAGPYPLDHPTKKGRRATRSQAGCALPTTRYRSQSPDSSGSEPNQAPGRKRGFNQVGSSPSAQQTARENRTRHSQGSQSRDAQFCTQRCLLGLQNGHILDESCPNATLHRQGTGDLKHPITADELMHSLKAQLDENIDRCVSLGSCGQSGAPFKLTCAIYGYTVIGKGTTSSLWREVSREAQAYRILQKAQASAVPVFLGAINLAKIYFLHGAGDIRHMLVMAWGGESIATMELKPWLRKEIHKSENEIKALGIIHEDLWCGIDEGLRSGNILWNEELRRALIIDFHRCTLKRRSIQKRPQPAKRRPYQTESAYSKRLRVL